MNIMVTGDIGVGKTSIIRCYANLPFQEATATTIGIDFVRVNYKPDLSEDVVEVKIWDTAGEERFSSFSTNFWKRSQGVVMVFDVNNRDSFENAKT